MRKNQKEKKLNELKTWPEVEIIIEMSSETGHTDAKIQINKNQMRSGPGHMSPAGAGSSVTTL
jgi:hypothetical protein